MKKFLRNDFVESICIGLSLIVIWAPAVFAFFDLNADKFLTSYVNRTWMNLFGVFVSMFAFHVFFDFIPKRKQKDIWIFCSIVVITLLLSIGYINWLKLGMRLDTYPKEDGARIDISYRMRAAVYQFYNIFYFFAIKLLLRYLKLKNKNQQLLLEKKISELNFLKSQTNPHFLFNTLNSIYALAREKSNITADTVLRLSDILRYMLYETQVEMISIDKEVEIIEDYIELEKMRYDETLKVSFEKSIDNQQQKIPPLLLIHLIENAFKHGASESISNPFILIVLKVKNGLLTFTVNNSIANNYGSERVKENIGLTNLRRQLSLLFTDYHINVNRNTDSFVVSIDINLASYAKN